MKPSNTNWATPELRHKGFQTRSNTNQAAQVHMHTKRKWKRTKNSKLLASSPRESPDLYLHRLEQWIKRRPQRLCTEFVVLELIYWQGTIRNRFRGLLASWNLVHAACSKSRRGSRLSACASTLSLLDWVKPCTLFADPGEAGKAPFGWCTQFHRRTWTNVQTTQGAAAGIWEVTPIKYLEWFTNLAA